jgi:hypothetical protein
MAGPVSAVNAHSAVRGCPCAGISKSSAFDRDFRITKRSAQCGLDIHKPTTVNVKSLRRGARVQPRSSASPACAVDRGAAIANSLPMAGSPAGTKRSPPASARMGMTMSSVRLIVVPRPPLNHPPASLKYKITQLIIILRLTARILLPGILVISRI